MILVSDNILYAKRYVIQENDEPYNNLFHDIIEPGPCSKDIK